MAGKADCWTIPYAAEGTTSRGSKLQILMVALVFQGEINLEENSEFDTTIVGPWMGQWRIIHHNKHTKQYKDPDGDAEKWANYQTTWTKAWPL